MADNKIEVAFCEKCDQWIEGVVFDDEVDFGCSEFACPLTEGEEREPGDPEPLDFSEYGGM